MNSEELQIRAAGLKARDNVIDWLSGDGSPDHDLADKLESIIDACVTAALAVQTQQGVEAGPTLYTNLVGMDDEDRTPKPDGYDAVRWQKADEVHHAMALVADDIECVKILYDALASALPPHLEGVPAVESEPVALIEREVLAELAKHKTATGTVCSPLFKGKFGDKVPLFAHPPLSTRKGSAGDGAATGTNGGAE